VTQKQCYKEMSHDRYSVVEGIPDSFLFYTFLFSVVIWIWAITVVYRYWDMLPVVAKIVAVFGLLPGLPLGPIASLVTVYVVTV